jgi:hypothetical protein
MYIAYKTEDQDGMSFMFPIGILRNKDEMKQFKEISPSYINIEKVPCIDMRKVKEIRYIDFWYYKDKSHGGSIGKTNSFFVKDVEKFNKVYISNGTVHIVKAIEKDENVEILVEKLEKISPKLLLKKEVDELRLSDENGIRANSLYIQINATDLLNNI